MDISISHRCKNRKKKIESMPLIFCNACSRSWILDHCFQFIETILEETNTVTEDKLLLLLLFLF